jgi:hypothetical protein
MGLTIPRRFNEFGLHLFEKGLAQIDIVVPPSQIVEQK